MNKAESHCTILALFLITDFGPDLTDFYLKRILFGEKHVLVDFFEKGFFSEQNTLWSLICIPHILKKTQLSLIHYETIWHRSNFMVHNKPGNACHLTLVSTENFPWSWKTAVIFLTHCTPIVASIAGCLLKDSIILNSVNKNYTKVL